MSALAAIASSLLSSAVTVEELIAQARKVANTGDAAGADALLVQAHELSPTLAEPLLLRGNVAAFLKRDASAAEELYKASLVLEQRWDAYYFLGKTLSARVLPTAPIAAAEAFEAAAKLNPTNAAPLLELGGAWMQAGSWERVHDAYRRAAATDLHSEKPLLDLARAAAKLGLAAETRSAYRNVTEMHPWHAATMLEYAQWLAEAPPWGGDVVGAAQACDLRDAAEVIEPGSTARLPPSLRSACPPAQGKEGASAEPAVVSAAELAAAAALEGGSTGACGMLVPFPALAARATVGDGGRRCVVRLRAGETVRMAVSPSKAKEASGGVLVRRDDELELIGDISGGGEGEGVGWPTLDALSARRHFLVEGGGTVRLRGLHLTGGRALLSSGGSVLLLPGGTLEAENVGFVANRAVFGSGGAIAARGGRLQLRRVAFEANQATWRGGALSLSGIVGGDDHDHEHEHEHLDADGHDETAGGAGVAHLERVLWAANGAARGADDVELCGNFELQGEGRAAVLDHGAALGTCGEAERDAACGFDGRMVLALEAQAEAGELLALGGGLEACGLALLRTAARADPRSPTAFASHFSCLYRHGRDAHAAARLAAFERARGEAHPMVAASRATLANASAPMLRERGLTLNSQAAALRKGLPALAPRAGATRHEAQHAAIEALAQAAALDPTSGDGGAIWDELGTACFFGGELAEASRVYARGLGVAPDHPKLQKEAAHARAYAGAFTPPPATAEATAEAATTAAAVRSFDDVDFRNVAMPPGAYQERMGSADVQRDASALFGDAPTVFVSRSPLMAAAECKAAVEAAEAWARRSGGWTTSRHYSVPTTDVPMTALPELLPWFNEALRTQLFPALSSRYPAAAADAAKLRVLDAFLVRYNAGAQSSLPTHSDQSLLSFTIALNDPTEYTGGGTWFEKLGLAVDAPAAGHVVMFPGKLEHAGHPISRGTRYVIVLFCGYDDNLSGKPEGWVLRRYDELRRRLAGGAAGEGEGEGTGGATTAKEEL